MDREELSQMTVLCGIDFSESSAKAAEVAVGIASRLKLSLYLVHALPDWAEDVHGDEKPGILTAIRLALEKEAERLRNRDAEVRVRLELDPPEESLIRVAREESAKLLVFGATGRGRAGGQPVGRTADRLAQQSRVPVLVVRSVEPFTSWIGGEKLLRVVVGLDFNLVSDEAWSWTQELARVGPVQVVGVHLYSLPNEFHRLGLSGIRSYVEPDPEVDRVLRRELEDRFQARCGASIQLRLQPSIGSLSDQLLSIASEVKADLVVIGSHQRSAIGRLWEGSVSRGVIHHAQSSVACIPLSTVKAESAKSEVRAVLAATDFSAIGNAALGYAYGQVGRGGRVYLVHVLAPAASRSQIEPMDVFTVCPDLADAKRSAEEKLRTLIPMRSIIYDKSTELLVLESRDPADAIAQAAERLAVDVICLGTHGRSGIAKALLGSVSQAVLSKTRRPVLLVHAPKE
jgi:nucleotide-binding universal stress UspA family protein